MNVVGRGGTRRVPRNPRVEHPHVAAQEAMARANADDGVEHDGAAQQRGADAVASVGTGGSARERALMLFNALARVPGELPGVEGSFGDVTAALTHARSQTTGELAVVLDEYIALRRRIAGTISTIVMG